ncbi:MAG: helix-turn-helix domain-containing protein [Sphingomonadaceae bacterium]|nr:helix-turn-helix domain-containing protein [Sphingomonadaceae bacterium]
MDDDQEEAAQLPLESAGDQLRRAREEAGLSLEQVASETRIPQRHLKVLEAGDYAALPGRTYAVGFARTYAKSVKLDEKVIAAKVREELGESGLRQTVATETFEPGDPARVPSRGLAWFSALAALLLIAGVFAFYRTMIAPGSGPASLLPDDEASETTGKAAVKAPKKAEQVVDPKGAVVFTALEDGSWIGFYDASGKMLMGRQMMKGESYTVPADAEGPVVETGRPYAFDITIGGKPVPKLSEEAIVVSDVPVSAAALLARGSAPADSGETAEN